MKVIDLLNKIANGEEVPKKIKYGKDTYIHIDNYCYYCEDTNLILSDKIFAEYSKLNDEIEIIEEPKKIEKLPYYSLEKIQKSKNKDEWYESRLELLEKRINDYHNKINELIDEINNLKEK